MSYDAEKFNSGKGDYDKIDLAGEYTATVKVCKMSQNDQNEDQWLVGFVVDDQFIHFERFTMNERFGWLFARMLANMGLGKEQRSHFEASMILQKQYVINIITNDKGFLRLDTVRPAVINNHLRPQEPTTPSTTNSDVPF